MPLTRDAWRGVVDVVTTPDGALRPLRLLAAQQRLAPEPLAAMGSFTSGVRLSLHTRATRLELIVDVDRLVMAHRDSPESAAEFLAEVGGRVVARATVETTSLLRERRDAEGYGRGSAAS